MKLCIIGPEKRTRTELGLIESAKKEFDSVLYIPYSSVILRNNEVIFKKTDFSTFDAVLPRISSRRSIFAYNILKNVKAYCPVTPRAYFLVSERFMMYNHLMKRSIPVPKICLLNSPLAASSLTETLEFPVSMRIQSEERGLMFANNRKEIKAMLDTLGTFNQTIYVEEYCGLPYVQALVIGSEVFAIRRKPEEKRDVYFGRGKAGECKLDDRTRSITLETARALEIECCCVDIGKNGVINVSISPPLQSFDSVLGINACSEIIDYVKKSAIRSKSSVFEKFLIDVKSAVKI